MLKEHLFFNSVVTAVLVNDEADFLAASRIVQVSEGISIHWRSFGSLRPSWMPGSLENSIVLIIDGLACALTGGRKRSLRTNYGMIEAGVQQLGRLSHFLKTSLN